MICAIYDKAGVIKNYITSASLHLIEINTPADCQFLEVDSIEYTHIVSGVPSRIVVEPLPAEMLQLIKLERNARLFTTDWTQTLDTPLTLEKKAEWATYRQQLRDFPETCDVNNPIWPVVPQ